MEEAVAMLRQIKGAAGEEWLREQMKGLGG